MCRLPPYGACEATSNWKGHGGGAVGSGATDASASCGAVSWLLELEVEDDDEGRGSDEPRAADGGREPTRDNKSLISSRSDERHSDKAPGANFPMDSLRTSSGGILPETSG